MNFARTDEQRLIGETLHRYLKAENNFEHRRARLNAAQPDRLALWAGLADMGVLGAAFDEAHGGFAGDARMLAVVMAQLGSALAVEPYLATAVMAGRVLAQLQDGAVAQSAIDALIAGNSLTVLAHDAGGNLFAAPRLQAHAVAGGYVLDGAVRVVRHADIAQTFLVTAMLADELVVFQLPRAALHIASYRLMDAAAAGDLLFNNLSVDAAARLHFTQAARSVIDDALEWGVFGLAAETAGLIEATNTATFEYLNSRKQFGVTLAKFQALQHRAADMKIAAEELFAMLELAIAALAQGPSAQRSVLLSATKAVADAAGRRVGHEAIQMHGGMGVSDELDISHFGRRLATIRAELGSADLHRLRFGTEQEVSGLLASQDDEQASAWRRTVREFTQKNLPQHIALKGELGLKIEKEDYVSWQKIMGAHGLFACAWPAEHGGQDWDLVKQLLFTQETAINSAPMLSPYGVKMVGPVIYSFGNEAQKAQHLPGILSNEIWWCQGYSEPGAGSDLASLKTFAELDGDHYIVNGAKLWTTEAHWADWMHCLVRTDREAKAQNGISFLLIDMATPGISIKPIVTIDGLHHTNATFFDNVRVPVSNRVGDEGKGWSIAKFLLANERVSIADTGPKLRLLKHVRAMYRAMLADASVPAAIKAQHSNKLADLTIQLTTLCAMERQYIEAWATGKPFGAEASILKIRGTEILQAICEFALEIEGPLAAAHDPADSHLPPDTKLSAAQHASLIGYEYLYSRCWSIFGGTNEIQRNIIAKQVLGV